MIYHKLKLNLAERSYPIYIGEQLLQRSDLLQPYIQGSQVMIVTNETIAPLYLASLKQSLQGYDCHEVILADGEEHKNLATLEQIFDQLIPNHFERQCTLIALGGGVIGDMAGFAAACYLRGVDFIQVPTTLLAQVDSSVGGKTGVNHKLGKNLMGAFHQPRCVLTDLATLKTLPAREYSAGIAEIIKTAIIYDTDFFAWLEDNMSAIMACEPETIAQAIYSSCRIKTEIVAQDEKESGIRALLNFGHTFGHAIEAGLGYGQWLHGEAVAAGMVAAAEFSKALSLIDAGLVMRLEALLQQAKLPTRAPQQLTTERILEIMKKDKKVVAGKVRLVLLNATGQASVVSDYDPQLLQQCIEAWRS